MSYKWDSLLRTCSTMITTKFWSYIKYDDKFYISESKAIESQATRLFELSGIYSKSFLKIWSCLYVSVIKKTLKDIQWRGWKAIGIFYVFLSFAAVKVGFKFWKKENFVEDIQDLCAQGMQIYLYSKS